MNTNTAHIDPKNIAAFELPICDRARHHYRHLWSINNAKDLCAQLVLLAAIPTITVEEYANIAVVANGGMWPVPDAVYTHDDWNRDRDMNAVAGQEIEESIYWEMFNVLCPMRLPRNTRTSCYDGGFLVSEPVTCDPAGKGMLYCAYGTRNGRFYYIGLLPCK